MTDVVTYETGMPPLGRAVVSVGVFDGVHLGHQALIRDAIALAREHEARAVVVTFDRDPDRIVDPAHAAPQLLELPDKLEALAALGPDVVLVVPFDGRVASLAPDAFLEGLLLRVLAPAAVVVGHDFRFGAHAAGDLRTLEAFGREHGFAVVGHPLVRVGDAPVTSTRVRDLVAAGDMRAAAELLGRPHRLRGEVEAGRHVGTSLGAPTANVRHAPYAAVPAEGVYAAVAAVAGLRKPAAVFVGAPPTFPGAPAAVEAHVLDVHADLYGEAIVLEFVERLRAARAFASAEELADAIAADVRRVREVTGPAD